MGDLRQNMPRRRELIEHITDREGVIQHFYCDHHGWVTIGVGELVDRPRAQLAVRRNAARTWFRRANVDFRHIGNNAVATEAQVLQDWDRAVAWHAAHGPARARDYAAQTQFRISANDARRLLGNKVDRFTTDLYNLRPYMIRYDERVAMALVDVRYNPAGVALYDMNDDPGDNFHPNIPLLWAALDSRLLNLAERNLDRALELFRDTWANRGNVRYQDRHRRRVEWFRAGIDATRQRARDEFDALIAELAAE